MQFIWEEGDIQCGRYICCNSYPENSGDISGLCSVTYKLGFIGGASSCMCEIAITDGLVITHNETEYKNARQILVDSLNDKCGYRPLNQEQIERRMTYLKNMNEGR